MGGSNCCMSQKEKKKTKEKPRSNLNPASINFIMHAFTELAATESSYGEDLKYMIWYYLDPLRSDKVHCDVTDMLIYNSVIFDLVKAQRKFEEQLNEALEGRTADPVDIPDITIKVADVFIRLEKDFEIYSKYIICMTRVQKVISKSQGIVKIVQYLENKFQEISHRPTAAVSESEPEDNESTTSIVPIHMRRIMTMESLILKPFQRVMVYPLILEKIRDKCEEGTLDEEKLLRAIQIIKNVGVQMNETLHEDEISDRLYVKLLKSYGIVQTNKFRHSSGKMLPHRS